MNRALTGGVEPAPNGDRGVLELPDGARGLPADTRGVRRRSTALPPPDSVVRECPLSGAGSPG